MRLKFDPNVYPRVQLACLCATDRNKKVAVEPTGGNVIYVADTNAFTEKSELLALMDVGHAATLLPPDDDIVAVTEVEHWVNFCINNRCINEEQLSTLFSTLNAHLSSKKALYLVGERLSVADIALFATFSEQLGEFSIDSCPALKRYFESLLKTFAKFEGKTNVSMGRTKNTVLATQATNAPKARKREGKYIDLPGAEKGKVIVRFPPEASGYLHIGHAKAALLNQYYQQNFEGKLILRFDDTNPAKETEHFEEIIIEDLKKLGVKHDIFTRTSDSFEKLLGYCEQLIKQGDAYVDSTDAEKMRKERESRTDSKCRNNTVEKNLKLWGEMKNGSEVGQKCCVRAKIDMKSDNGCLRDPTLYRCKNEEHICTGTKYKVYPTYDFACPIVDSIEDVTHVLRTTEYHDRDDQYFWIISKLGLRKPYIWEYSRLNLQHTVMSKRKLTWLVDNGYVMGWDDPRLPTVRGVFRRGMTVEGLKEFVIAQGSSTKVVTMDWSKIWAINKQVIDPVAPRFVAVLKENVVEVAVEDVSESSKLCPKHPKNPCVGEKTVWHSSKLVFDQADAAAVKEGEVVTFVNWGNLIVKKIHRDDSSNLITSLDCKLNLENKDYKNTQKFTWLAATSSAPFVPTVCVHFGPILSKPVLGKDDDFKACVNTDSLFKFDMLGEPGIAELKKGDIIQLMRRGYYIVDEPYRPPDANTCKAQPCVLFHVPDGHVKELPTAVTASVNTDSKQETEKSPGSATSADELNEKIAQQGNKIRQLKSEKAAKDVIGGEVQTLLALKAEYKKVTGSDWVPGAVVKTESKKENEKPPVSAASADELNEKITQQGNKIRQLKSEKAAKDVIGGEVQTLLALKAEYKKMTGSDWVPGAVVKTENKTEKEKPPVSAASAIELDEKITVQGNKIRQLKSEKAAKAVIGGEVQILLALKTEYKKVTGSDWVPGAAPPDKKAPTSVTTDGKKESEKLAASAVSVDELDEKITQQGNKIRQLKSEKAAKAVIDGEVQTLLALKAEYKNLAGRDWVPGKAPSNKKAAKQPESNKQEPPKQAKMSEGLPDQVEKLNLDITAQGDKIRKLKSEKADKATVEAEVKVLLSLKSDYAKLAGRDWAPAGGGGGGKQQKDKSAKKEQKKPEPKQEAASDKKTTRLGLEAKKEDSFADWYTQVITKAELIEYYDVSGCYVLRPTAYAIWERIQAFFDAKIKKLGVENCYFPIFVSKAALEREKTHISDFAPEVAWVTKSGGSELAEPIAIRPTSETVMYPAYARWVQSHRDLPIRLNQWCSVVRWEFKNPTPFIRTREFLWQEGHTAFATAKEAETEVFQILDFYAQVYEDLLAIPVIKGIKTVKERFAGADFTTTTELYIPMSGRGLQGATSHHLGQNFSKMFGIEFEDPANPQQKLNAWQNSWGLSTRSIGAVVMIHGDNNGLVLPPRVAINQVVIVPVGITASTTEEKKAVLIGSAQKLYDQLIAAGVRAKADLRENITPGWKFNHWELKGIPLRVELGPRELEKGEYVLVRRDTGEKATYKLSEAATTISAMLETIHKHLYDKAKAARDSHTVVATKWRDFCDGLALRKIILAPFCGGVDCEEAIKDESAKESQAGDGTLSMGAKSLCIPMDKKPLPADARCINPHCNAPPKAGYTLFGRSY